MAFSWRLMDVVVRSVLLVAVSGVSAVQGADAARFVVEPVKHWGEDAYVLRDVASGATARILPAMGARCVSLTLPVGPGSTMLDVLLEAMNQSLLNWRGMDLGMPVLFPWTGQLPGGQYEFGGRTYRLYGGRGRPTHGFVNYRAWRVESTGADATSASLRCSIASQNCPDVKEGYPFLFRLSITYTLTSGALTATADVFNEGKEPMPFGFGLHPYIRTPLGAGSSRDKCSVQIPASKQWDADAILRLRPGSGVAGGMASARQDLVVPVPGDEDPRVPRMPAAGRSSRIYAEVESRDGQIECLVRDNAARVRLAIQSSPNLNTVVLFTPNDEKYIGVEPWSCPPNVFNVASAGQKDSGLTVVPPGGHWQAWVRFSVSTE